MEKEFVPYELAVKLKPIGFNEPTSYSWVVNQLYPNGVIGHSAPGLNHNAYDNHLSAPTFSQAFRWFREKHNLDKTIDSWTEQPMIDEIWDKAYQYYINGEAHHPYFKTYEEAELDCLNALIEIVESKTE